MFYRLSSFAIAAALFGSDPVQAQDGFPNGVWSDAERTVVVVIAPCAPPSAAFCGTMVQDNRPGPAANPAGHQMLRDLKQGRAGWKGKLFDGGMQLNLTMRPQSPDAVQVRYCFGVICENETWQKISSVPASNTNLRR